MTKAFISGCAGTSLTSDERAFFTDERPWGFILFARNCVDPAQITALTADLRMCVGANVPIFIDQEGGRVQRLRPPIWRDYPTGKSYGALYERDHEKGERATFLGARLIAADLMALGIDANCLPVLDLPVVGAHDVIGDRAYANKPETVSHLGAIAADGLLSGGVLPVIKHIPGHGRAASDSHFELPVVDTARSELERTDFAPFKALSHFPMAMTAHVVYSALDDKAPCSTSPFMIRSVIRTLMGFDGFLMSDDVSMNALDGEIGERTAACFAAGCDCVLHCNGKFDEMRAVADNTPQLDGKAQKRAEDAVSWRKTPDVFDAEAGWRELLDLMT